MTLKHLYGMGMLLFFFFSLILSPTFTFAHSEPHIFKQQLSNYLVSGGCATRKFTKQPEIVCDFTLFEDATRLAIVSHDKVSFVISSVETGSTIIDQSLPVEPMSVPSFILSPPKVGPYVMNVSFYSVGNVIAKASFLVSIFDNEIIDRISLTEKETQTISVVQESEDTFLQISEAQINNQENVITTKNGFWRVLSNNMTHWFKKMMSALSWPIHIW